METWESIQVSWHVIISFVRHCTFNKKKKNSQKEKIFFKTTQAWVKNKLGLAYKKKGEAIIAIDIFNHSAALNLEIENKIGFTYLSNSLSENHLLQYPLVCPEHYCLVLLQIVEYIISKEN